MGHRKRDGLTRLAIAAAAAALAVGLSCHRRPGPPQIAFVYPATADDKTVGRLAQQDIDRWRPLRVAEIAVSMSASRQTTELGRNVAWADAAARLPAIAGAVGHLGSRTTLLVAPVYTEARVPLVVPISTSRRLGQVGPWVFPLAPNEDAEGEFLVEFTVSRLRAARVTVVYLSADEYGAGLRESVVAALKRRGLGPADEVGVLDDSDHERLLDASVRRATPDALILAVRPATARAIAAYVHRRLPGVPIVAGDAVFLSSTFAASLGDAAAVFHAAAFWHPDLPRAESRAFVERCRAAGVRDPTASAAMFYDGLMIVAAAIRDTDGSPDAVRRYLRDLGTSHPAYEGVTGSITFAAKRPINLVMTTTRGGRVVIAGGR